jgi:hypothetical protein
MPNNTINFLLKFLVDKGSQAEAQKAIKDLSKPSGMGQGAGKIDLDVGGNVVEAYEMMGGKLSDVINTFAATKSMGKGLSPKEIEASVDEFMRVNEELDKVDETIGGLPGKVDETTKAVNKMNIGFAGFLLAMTGRNLQNLGKSLLGPMTQFIEQTGMASEVSARWAVAQQNIGKSITRIGSVMAESMLPMLETASDVLDKVADFVEKNPWIAQSIAYIGGFASLVGTLMIGIGSVIQALGVFQMLGGAQFLAGLTNGAIGTAAVAGGAGAGAGAAGASVLAALTAAAPFIGAAIGLAAAVIITKSFKAPGSELSYWDEAIISLKKSISNFVVGMTLALFGAERAKEVFLSLGDSLGLIADNGDQASKSMVITDTELKAFIAYRQQEAEAEKRYGDERTKIVEDSAKQRADIEANYEKRRNDIIKNYENSDTENLARLNEKKVKAARESIKQENDAEADYYRRRMIMARDYSIEVQREEEDHQRKMRRMQEDHNQRSADLLMEADAWGLLREDQKYEQDRRNAEEDYRVEAARRSEDFARKLGDMEAEFALQREQRQKQRAQNLADEQAAYIQERAKNQEKMKQELADLDAQNKEELAKADIQAKDKLRQLDKSYQDDKARRQRAFADQLRDLDASLLNEQNTRNAYYNAMTNDLKTWLATYRGVLQSNLPGYPTNGVQGLSNKTLGGKSSSMGVTYNDNRKIAGDVSPQMRDALKADTLSAVREAIYGS